jgi:hypothetical protein
MAAYRGRSTWTLEGRIPFSGNRRMRFNTIFPAAMAVLVAGCGAKTLEPKARISLKVPPPEVAEVRRFIYELSIRWSLRFCDSSFKFPDGVTTTQASLQRPDGLEAALRGFAPSADASPGLGIDVYCDKPCKDWQPFVEALQRELSPRWRTIVTLASNNAL